MLREGSTRWPTVIGQLASAPQAVREEAVELIVADEQIDTAEFVNATLAQFRLVLDKGPKPPPSRRPGDWR